MKILIAPGTGFCFGVRRATEKIEKAVDSGSKVQTFGQLIHNPEYSDYLKNEGVTVAESVSEIDCDQLVTRAHGLPKEIEAEIAKTGVEIIDATCPLVKKVQRLAEEYAAKGYTILLLGEDDHPEIVGIRSYAPDLITVTDLDSLPDLPPETKIAFLSQTTQSLEKFKEVETFLRSKYQNLEVLETICDASEKNQEAARELAKQVDVMIVIGGKNSSNTTRLAELAAKETETYHIEHENELIDDWFKGVEVVGVAAGASTPCFSIERVQKHLERLTK